MSVNWNVQSGHSVQTLPILTDPAGHGVGVGVRDGEREAVGVTVDDGVLDGVGVCNGDGVLEHDGDGSGTQSVGTSATRVPSGHSSHM